MPAKAAHLLDDPARRRKILEGLDRAVAELRDARKSLEKSKGGQS